MSVYINVGCGANLLPSPWRNLDLDRPNLADRVDITKPLPFENESVDRILIEHCLEHVNSANGMRFLLEAYRVLKYGGVLRVCVPSLRYLSDEQRRDICMNHGHEQIYSEESLHDFMHAAGFRGIEITPISSEDGHRWQIGEEKDRLETLRMEGTKR